MRRHGFRSDTRRSAERARRAEAHLITARTGQWRATTFDVRVDLDSGALVARHTHPGIEMSYVVDGALELSVDGQGTRTFKAGDGFQVPTRTPHSGKNGDKPTIIAITYIVEKASPSPRPLEAKSEGRV